MTALASFDRQVAKWIGSVDLSTLSFGELISQLPSVYPGEVARIISSLAEGPTTSENYQRILADARIPSRLTATTTSDCVPWPSHPLDFDWRFDDLGTCRITAAIRESSRAGSDIHFLGVPSLFFSGVEYVADQKLRLYDKNVGAPPEILTRDATYNADLTCPCSAVKSADVIVIDPPWYPEYLIPFVWNASNALRSGGILLAVLPPRGTRPGIKKDINEVLNIACKCGLRLINNEPTVIPYRTPFFERNALRAEGIHNVPDDWRKGDLFLFEKVDDSRYAFQPRLLPEETWDDFNIFGVRIKVHVVAQDISSDPSLESLLPGDILPSVSRRHPLRSSANVWTSGNRVYRSRAPRKLCTLLRALTSSPVLGFAGRAADSVEDSTIKQILSLVHLELDEARG